MKTRAELKALAKQQIKGKIGILFLISLVIAIISGAASSIPFASIIVDPALMLSTYLIYCKLSSINDYRPEIGETFGGFSNVLGAMRVYWAQALFTFLWTMLFIIPGIIKGIAYSQAMFILAENPEIGGREALKKSSEMMQGHKMDYFILSLSFIGWNILAVFTFGILYVWLAPYISATQANFYQSIKPVDFNFVPENEEFQTA